jgi:hypothetical protein
MPKKDRKIGTNNYDEDDNEEDDPNYSHNFSRDILSTR